MSRRQGRMLMARLAPLILVAVATACTGGGGDEELTAGARTSGDFIAAEIADCPRSDLLSIQKGPSSGSIVSLDITLTDCDGSLLLNGAGFEVSFDGSVMDFVGCNAGSLFPPYQLAPGTPVCASAGSGVLGSIDLVLPNSVTVPAGKATVARLTFNVRKAGIAAPITLQNIDSLHGTAVFYADPLSQSVSILPLGAAGYAGGTMTSH